MFARYVVFVLVALAECAALGAPRFRMVLDLEGTYRNSLTASHPPQPTDRYFNFDEVWTLNGASSFFVPYYFNGTENVWVGLRGDGYTSAIGRSSIHMTSYNAAGQATGFSSRNADNQWGPQHAWYFDGVETHRIGLCSNSDDPACVSQSELPTLPIGPDGKVVGAMFVNSQARIHERAWIFDGSRTREIGLLGAEYRGPINETSNSSWELTAQGHVYGGAARFNGQTDAQGNSLWYDDGTSTTAIGLTGPGYESSSGTRRANYVGIMNTGHAMGSATRFRGEEEVGNTLWYFNGFSTVPVGLRDSEHTRSDGYQSGSGVRASSKELYFAGVSSRHLGGDQDLGNTPWLFDGDSTIPIGLTDSTHTRSDHKIAFVSNTGFVAGYADRFAGDGNAVRDAWLYNPLTNQTETIPLPKIDNFIVTPMINGIGDDGVVLGTYVYTDERLVQSFSHFYYSSENGFHDLATLVVNGSPLARYNVPPTALRTESGIIYGRRAWDLLGTTPDGMGDVVLIPIPEPSTLALAALALATFFRRSRGPMRCSFARIGVNYASGLSKIRCNRSPSSGM
jgi:hypothetical protein